MTAQISDSFVYKGRRFELAGISDESLFDPAQLGIHPVGYCTSCYRGYVAVFSVHEERLVLKDLDASLYADGSESSQPGAVVGPVIRGVAPLTPDPKEYSQFNNIYKNINVPLDYSGGLLIASGFISELYEHMGFHPPWKYRCVRELVFDKGRLEQDVDRSKRMSEVREKILTAQSSKDEDDGIDHTDEFFAWIAQSFDRSYEL